MTLNPHELINLPHGKAKLELKKAGLWDETAIADGNTEFEFTVDVTGYYNPSDETVTITVKAKTKEDAIEEALEECDFDEITDSKIISVDTIKD
jgi:phage replication-related protein YjqB (UPF0714/DUF867 family)